MPIARRMQHELESYKLPSAILKGKDRVLPKKISPIFRDETDLSVGDLDKNLHEELEQSKYLIVICSPNSANPNDEGKNYVNGEVEHFCKIGREDFVIPVIVRGTPNEAFCPKLKELGKLALDATKMPRERIVNDIVAKILGLKPDELWRRESRRRRRSAIVRLSLSLFAFTLFVLSSWYYYDWNREKIVYYKDYVDRNGVPQGLFPIDKDAIKGRDQTYRFHFQGYYGFLPWKRTPMLRRMFCVNSFNQIIEEQRDSPLHPKAAGMLFHYGEHGAISEIHHVAINGYKTVILHFSGERGRLVEVIRRGYDGRMGTVQKETKRREKVHRYQVERDALGFVRAIAYQGDMKGTPVSQKGIYGKYFKTDELGRVTAVTTCNWDGKPQVGDDAKGDEFRYEYAPNGDLSRLSIIKDGLIIASEEYAYDAKGNRTSTKMYDANGLPVDKGWFENLWTYDEFGSWVTSRRFDKEGKPIKAHDSCVERKIGYSNGRIATIDVSYYDENGNPGQSREGVSRSVDQYNTNGMKVEMRGYRKDGTVILPVIRRRYDETLQEIEVGHFDEVGTPVMSGGWAFHVTERRFESANDGLKITRRYLDADRHPVYAGAERCASEVTSIDKLGRVVEWSYYGLEGKRILNNNGFHSVRFKYDKFGNISEIAFFGIDGQPVLASGMCNVVAPDKVHAIRFINDALGNCLETTTWNVDESLMNVQSRGYAKEVNRYDAVGRRIDSACFDEKGNRTCPKVKDAEYYRMKTVYNDDNGGKQESRYHIDGTYKRTDWDGKGNLLQESYHNADDTLRQDEYGIAQVKYKYDEKGHQVKKGFFDVHGRRVLSTEGIAGWESFYDNQGGRIEERRFGLDGKTCNANDGIAIIRWRYDEAHHQVAKDFFDANGNPVPNSDGDCGVRWEYDGQGNKTASYSIDRNGKCKIDSDGIGIARYEYDKKGRVVKTRFFDVNGQPTKNKEGIGGWSSEYDDAGNEACRMFFDEKEKPCMCNGCGGWRNKFDDKGRQIEYINLDCNGNMAAQYLIIGGVEMKFGRCTISYGRDGRRTVIGEGFNGEIFGQVKKTRVVYTLDGDVEQIECMNEAGNLVTNSLGYARKEIRHNEFREVTEESYWDAEGRPAVFLPEMNHRVVVFYKRTKEGLVLDLRYYDTDGFPVVGKTTGFARQVVRYDAQGRLLSLENFDERNLPKGCPKVSKGFVEYGAEGKTKSILLQSVGDSGEVEKIKMVFSGDHVEISLLDDNNKVKETKTRKIEDVPKEVLNLGRIRYSIDSNRRPTQIVVPSE